MLYVDLNAHFTNLANMKVMKNEIARLNSMLDTKGKNSKKSAGGKVNQLKKPQYLDGRNPHIKDGLGHKKGAKTNGRKVVNGIECVQFMSKGKAGTEKPAQSAAQKQT